MTSAVVVGSGPNGLAGALVLAEAGLDVTVVETSDRLGGGTRSSELTLPGLLHDECSGFHPLSLDTPFSRAFDLEADGLTWRWPEVQFAHPLEGGRGAAVWQDVDDTARSLGEDGARWRGVFGALDDRFDKIAPEFLQPVLHAPRHPVALARFGAFSALPTQVLARLWRTEEGRALVGGLGAHSFRPLSSPFSAAIGVALGTAAHRYGWPVAEGGSQAIADAMVAAGRRRGVTYETGRLVRSLDELDRPDVVLLDTSPAAAADIVGSRMPHRIARAYRRYRHGPGSFKVDFAVEGGVPWSHQPTRSAGTVHVGGTLEDIALAEREVAAGRMPDRPFVLVGQQSVADPGRAADGVVPLYSYAHVPTGFQGDATEAITAQIERFAPGFRDRVRAVAVTSTTELSRKNPNYVGGDIVTGANDARQLVFRPRATMRPYATGVPGVFLCSAATPPGAGAHGMCGFHGAHAALAELGLG